MSAIDPATQAFADQLRMDIVKALERQDYAAVLEGMQSYRALQSEGIKLPVGLLFAEAEAAKSSGDWQHAKSALDSYLERADQSDPLYQEALKLDPVVEAEVARQIVEQQQALAVQRQAEQRIAEEQRLAERKRLLDGLVNDTVEIPAGRFKMGDLARHGEPDELPVRTLQVAAFRLGRREVTFDQFDAFCEATGRTRPDDKGWGRGNRPVMNVNWDDANEFIAWLNAQTLRRFRLPTEAEWEYAARAGTDTDYWWGETFSTEYANASGTGGNDRFANTAPVGEFPPNPFGLHDMQGNVREWVQDCWVPGYQRAPKTAVARLDGDCSKRIVRGGAWNLGPGWLRASNRDYDEAGYRYVDRGFRLASDP